MASPEPKCTAGRKRRKGLNTEDSERRALISPAFYELLRNLCAVSVLSVLNLFLSALPFGAVEQIG
jgi:hypothetical protein